MRKEFVEAETHTKVFEQVPWACVIVKLNNLCCERYEYNKQIYLNLYYVFESIEDYEIWAEPLVSVINPNFNGETFFR